TPITMPAQATGAMIDAIPLDASNRELKTAFTFGLFCLLIKLNNSATNIEIRAARIGETLKIVSSTIKTTKGINIIPSFKRSFFILGISEDGKPFSPIRDDRKSIENHTVTK